MLAADKLMQSPQLYAMFLLWLMSELFAELPEIGDPDKPRLVFFFDEAHLLFDQAPKALLDKVEQVTRLIRSKGVGVYYVTQNPLDVPEAVAGQLGNRIQHALRAFTPREQKAVKAAATTFRPNPDLDTEKVIMELGVGEALVSTLEAKGTPAMVGRTLIRPPSGRLGPVTADERQAVIKASPVFGQYEKTIDREFGLRDVEQGGREKGSRAGAPRAHQPAGEERSRAARRVSGAADRARGRRAARQRPPYRPRTGVTPAERRRGVHQVNCAFARQCAGVGDRQHSARWKALRQARGATAGRPYRAARFSSWITCSSACRKRERSALVKAAL